MHAKAWLSSPSPVCFFFPWGYHSPSRSRLSMHVPRETGSALNSLCGHPCSLIPDRELQYGMATRVAKRKLKCDKV